ncbi:MAG: DUF3488 and DUF4129 domain-containing transglutaminase family protein [Acidobacteriota bacterium]
MLSAGRALQLATLAWCEICTLAVILTGDIPLWLSAFVLAGIPLAGLATEKSRWLAPARTASSVMAVGYLLFFPFDWLMLSEQLIFAVAHLIFYLKLHTLLHLRSRSDRNRLYVLCLFEMLAAASMTVDLTFVLALVLFVMSGSLVLVLDQLWTAQTTRTRIDRRLRGSVWRTAITLGTSVLVLAGATFVVLPRTIYGGFRLGGLRGITTTGLADKIRLGDFGEIKLSRDVVMRVVAGRKGSPSPPRWRGAAYDLYLDGQWSRTLSRMVVLPESAPGQFLVDRPSQARRTLSEVFLEPLDTDILFLPPASLQLDVALRYVFVDRYLTLRTGGRARAGRRYQVTWRPDAPVSSSSVGGIERVDEELERRYLQVPPLTAEFHRLARRLLPGGGGRLEKAAVVESYLKEQYRYTLETPPRRRQDPLEDFLFEARGGHCEYFATAMAMLVRSQDIPSRLVTGFSRGELNELGDFEIVRKLNAHAWVEVFDPQRGWVAFDPTPPAPALAVPAGLDFLSQGIDSLRMLWDMYVVAYDRERQRSILGAADQRMQSLLGLAVRVAASFKRWAKLLAGAGALLLAVFLLSRTRLGLRGLFALRRFRRPFRRLSLGKHRPESRVRFYGELLDGLERMGFAKPPGQTPEEYARALEPQFPGLRRLTRLYYQIRFGDLEPGPEEEARAERLSIAIQVAALSSARLGSGSPPRV